MFFTIDRFHRVTSGMLAPTQPCCCCPTHPFPAVRLLPLHSVARRSLGVPICAIVGPGPGRSRVGLLPHQQARHSHICAAQGQGSDPHEAVTVLQGPHGTAAAYVVGVSSHDGTAATVQQLESLAQQLAGKQPQQQVVLLLGTQAAAPQQAAARPQPDQQQLQQQQQQRYPPGLEEQCKQLADAYGWQFTALKTQALPAGAAAAAGSNGSSSGSLGLIALLASGLGLVRRTAAAAAAAVSAVTEPGADNEAAAGQQGGADLTPDLPDLDLRWRRRVWAGPERAAQSWQAAVLLCRLFKQLEDQGYQVVLPVSSRRGKAASRDAAERRREIAVYECLALVSTLLLEALSESQRQSHGYMPDYEGWLAVLLTAQDPHEVVRELKALLEEHMQTCAAFQEQGLAPPEVLPTAADVARSLDAKYEQLNSSSGESTESSNGDKSSSSEGTSSSSSSRAGDADEQASSSDSSTRSSRESTDTQQLEGSPSAAAAADPAAAPAAEPSAADAADAHDSDAAQDSGKAAQGDGSESSSSSSTDLAASDAVISARSGQRLLDAMMQLEKSWAKAAQGGSSSGSSDGSSAGSDKSSNKSNNMGSGSEGSDEPLSQPDQLESRAAADASPVDSSSSSAPAASADAAADATKGRSSVRRISKGGRSRAAADAASASDAAAAAAAAVDARNATTAAAAAADELLAAIRETGALTEQELADSSIKASNSDAAAAAAAAAPHAPADSAAAAASVDDEESDSEAAAADAEFQAHVHAEFARFEDYLAESGVDLSREARVQAFIEVYLDEGDGESDSDDEGLVSRGAQDPDDTLALSALLEAILSRPAEDSSSSSSGGSSDGSSDGSSGSTNQSQGPPLEQRSLSSQQRREQQQEGSKGAQGSSSQGPSGPGLPAGMGALSLGPSWDQLRVNFGQDGLDKLLDMLRADSFRVKGWEAQDVSLLFNAFGSIREGERMSTEELRVVAKLLKDADVQPSSSSSSTSGDLTSRAARAARWQRPSSSSSSRRGSGTARGTGLSVSAKDTPHASDMRSMRVPKKPRGEQAQQKLRRLRQLRQQRQLSRQARAEQLQVWQVAAQLQKQWQLQQQQQDAAAAGPQQEAGTVQGVGPVVQPAPGSSSSSDGGSSSSGTMAASPSSPSVDSAKKGRWMAAVQRFKAAWKQGKQQQQQQPRPSPLSPAGSDAAVGDAQAASEAVVQELQAWLAGAAAGVAGRPVASTGPQTEDSVGVLVIAVLPLQQLPLVKQAWGRQGSQ